MFNQIFGGANNEKMSRYGAWSLLLLSCFLLVQVISGLKKLAYIGKDIYPQRTIIVSGDGEAFAIPDIASFSFSIVESGKTVAEAQEKADQKINKATVALKETGIDEKDIKTTNYSFYPKYDWQQSLCPQSSSGVPYPCPGGKNVLTGYEVNETITVKVREPDKAGDLVTKIGALGASNVSGVEFTVDDKDKYVSMAREQAIAKAKANASKLAKDLGIRLGKILYFNESGNYPLPIYGEGMRGDMKVSAVSPTVAQLPAGESKITSQVSLTYEIR